MADKKHAIDKDKYEVLRKRWDHEDTLLMSRTGTFLTANSILWVALGFQPSKSLFPTIVGVIGLALSILWLTTSLHSFHVIKVLFGLTIQETPYGLEKMFDVPPVLFRPNTVFGKIIPGLMIAGWLVEIGSAIWVFIHS